jgi:hypothetical protein
MKRIAVAFILCAALLGGCSKPLAQAKVVDDLNFLSRDYAANANDAYYAVRWALKEVGIPVESEDLPSGVIKTKWVPVTSDSHYVETFGRPDYGVTNSYHQLEIHISFEGGRSVVKVASRAKTLASNFKSSGVIERKVLDATGDYLRGAEPTITNLGISE